VFSTPAEFFNRLRESGVGVCEFNPVNPLKGKSLALDHRDHRKILVVDGTIGFTGGITSATSTPAALQVCAGRVQLILKTVGAILILKCAGQRLLNSKSSSSTRGKSKNVYR
jgi:hypothetical protein